MERRLVPFALKAARQMAGLSQARLAEVAKLSVGYVAMLETGQRRRPSPAVMTRLAEACGVNVDDIACVIDTSASGEVDQSG